MRTLVSMLAICLGCGAALVAQQQRLQQIESELSQTKEGSERFYELSLDLLDAWYDVQVSETAERAQQLWRRASDDGQPGVASAAAARAAFALSYCEGPTAAEPWMKRATAPDESTSAYVRADYYLTRARTLCFLGRHAEELPLAITGQQCAEDAGDWLRRAEALLMTLHTTPQRGPSVIRRIVEDARAAGAEDQLESLRPFFLLQDIGLMRERGNIDGVLSALDRVEQMSQEQGNRRVLARLPMLRAELANRADDAEAEMKWLREARRRAIEHGDLFRVIVAIDTMASVSIARDNLELAHELVDEQAELIEGRGWKDAERELLATQFQLAVKEHDGARADELSRAIDRIDAEDQREAERYVEVSERLAAAELASADFESQLQQARLDLAERSQAFWMWSAIAGVLGLGALLAVSRLGRNRLVAANAELAEQVRRVEAAKQEQQQLEERMRQLERTEGLGTLAAGIAHDFNNLLTSMIGGAEMLRARDDDPEQRELSDMILASGEQGARLCRQLQAYSGGTPLQREPYDLAAVTREMLPTLHASVKNGLSVELLLDATGGAVARVDRGQFEQILLNLVQNSHEAGARHVTIRILDPQDLGSAFGESSLPIERLANAVVLEVRDDGNGMSPEVVQRIFDPFFTTKFPGRGLGLAVVFGGVRRHGGTVHVDSAEQRGTRFVIQLPKVSEPTVVLPRPERAPTKAAGEVECVPSSTRVVAVDDEPIVRQVLESMFKKLGVDAQCFEDGDVALANLRTSAHQGSCIALIDLTMPGMSGEDVVAGVRQHAPEARIVLMSGHDSDTLDELASRLQAHGVLRKPFVIEDVRRVLQTVSGVQLTG